MEAHINYEMALTARYQCINHCLVFETPGTPHYCPHCGVSQVFPVDEKMEQYETYEEGYENAHSK